jgi:hypothetical protein
MPSKPLVDEAEEEDPIAERRRIFGEESQTDGEDKESDGEEGR